jgi:hypothetical protein
MMHGQTKIKLTNILLYVPVMRQHIVCLCICCICCKEDLWNPDPKQFFAVLVFCGILILNNFVLYLCFVES